MLANELFQCVFSMEKKVLKSNTSKERWQILRNFITNKSLNVQHKRSHVFGLFASRKITDFKEVDFDNDSCSAIQVDYEWIEYNCELFPLCRLDVRQRIRSVNWSDATGFDNTGNICVWPSEEILSYLCIKNSEDFREKIVCELGAGMTGLAGMMLAVASNAEEVLVTDGNIDGVENLEEITRVNKRRFGETKVHTRQLRWDKMDDYKDIESSFDYVLCADCLLYEDVQDYLLEVIKTLLKHDGIVLIVSPQRGSSVQHFIEKAQKYFVCKSIENYDEFVWSAYIKEKELSCLSEVTRNFPILIEMRRTPC